MPALQAATGDARLMLGRFRMTTRIPRDRAAAGDLSVNPNMFFADHVAPALKEVLAPLLDSGDPSVWIIRRLDIKILSDRTSGHNAIGRAISRSFRQAMIRAFNGEGNLTAVRFPDRASYLAQFLVDLTDGRAWDRWYYRPFADFRPLPFGPTVRMLIEREQPYALSALIKVDERGRLQKLVQRLGENEAHRAYSALVPLAEARAIGNEPVIALAEMVLRQPTLLAHGTGHRTELALLVTAAARLPMPLGTIAGAIDAMFGAVTIEDRVPTTPRSGIAGAPDAHTGQPRSRRALVEQVEAVAKRLRSGEPHSATERKAARAGAASLATPFAGVFLLWRSAVELGLDRLVTEGFDVRQASIRRLALAATLAGPQWRVALDDEAVKWLVHVAEQPDDAEIGAALTFSDVEHEALAQGLLAISLSVRPSRPLNLLLQHDGQVVVLQDADRQDWLATAIDDVPTADFASTDVGWLLSPEDIGIDGVPAPYRSWRRLELEDSSFALLAPEPELPYAKIIAQARNAIAELRPLGGDLSYFDVRGVASNRRSALLRAVLARAAYSDLARRLPGLELSSAHYLGRNVVQGVGTFTRSMGGHDAEVVLPSVPMDVVLRMTGLDRTVLRLGDGRSVLIRLPGG